MLQKTLENPVPQRVSKHEPGYREIGTDNLFTSYLSFGRRQYAVILFSVLVAVGLATVYVMGVPPGYTAEARLIIDTRKNQIFQQQSVIGDAPIDSVTVESQVEILKSENIALTVIKDLNLAEEAEFVGSSGGLIGAIGSFVSDYFGFNEPASSFELTRRALRVFEGRLGVRRVGLTYVIELTFRSTNPERAATITNAVADAYITDQLEAKYQATRRASNWLQDRIRELRDQASAADRAVVEFKAKHNIVDAGGGKLMNEQQLGELNSQLVTARANTSEARARLDRVVKILEAEIPDATVADTLKSDVISKLRSQYLELAAREADWSARYGRNHLAAVDLRNRMRELRRAIHDELNRIAETYKSDFEIAKQREDSIRSELAQAVSLSQVTSQAQVQLRDLESTAESYRQLYDNFLQRYMESIQQQSFPITEARVISPASRPLTASHPRTMLVLALSVFGGVVVGVGIGMLREVSDRVLRTSGQVETLLQTDCIALVPLVKIPSGKQGGSDSVRDAGSIGPREIMRDGGIMWTTVDSPFSRFTEEIRSIKLAVDLNSVVKSNKVIGFTSSLPDEGKSTLATAFAQLAATVGARVILVDCDLRNPSLSRKFAADADIGILDVISGDVSLEEAVLEEPTTRMCFLPAVVKSRLAHSNEILASDATKRLFDRLRNSYDYVVVDFSPIAPVVDVRATAHLVDSYIFVIEWGRTKIDVVEQALRRAEGVYQNLLGTVLNKANINMLGRYEGSSGNYYSYKHYSRYGYSE